jgi:hypothetical protein
MAQGLRALSPDDAWRAFVTREAGKEIGQWLEGRGRLHHPIARLTLGELTIMADNAISRFIVLASERSARRDPLDDVLTRFLCSDFPAPCVPTSPEGSSSIKPSSKQAKADGSSAPCDASMAGHPSCAEREEA